jgi:hypothetical protein
MKEMDAWKLALLLLAVWTLVRFWLHPLLERNWVNGDLKVKALRAGTFAAIELSRNVLARVIAVLAVVLAILVIAGWLGNTDTVFPQSMISTAAGWAEGFRAIQSDTLGTITLLTIIAAGIVLYRAARTARVRVRAKLVEHIEATRQKLASNTELLEQLSADSQFAPVFAELNALGERRTHILGLDDTMRAKAAEELKNLDAAIGQRSNFIVVTYAMRDFDAPKALATAVPGEAVEEPTEPQSRWSLIKATVLRILGSRGLAHDLGLVRSNVERMATVLLVISLLSWSSAAMANSLALAATNLQVVFDKDRATRSLDQALSDLPPPTPSQRISMPNAEVSRVSRSLAREFVSRVVRRDLPTSLGVHVDNTARYDDEATRLAILEARVEPAHPGDVGDQIRAESLAADIQAKGANERAVAVEAKLSARFATRLTQIRDESPGAWAAIVEHAKRHFDDPIELWDAQQKLLETALGQALNIEPEGVSEISKQGAELLNEFGQKALSTWVDARMQDYLGSVVVESLGPNFAFRSESPRSIDWALGSESREVLEKAAPPEGVDHEPWHTVRSNPITGDDRSREAMLAKVNDLTGGSVQPEVRDTIMGYDGTFPGRSRTVSEAVMGTVSEAVESGTRGLASGAMQAAMQASVDFLGAARGGLARGVIFGRTPEGDAPALTDLRWHNEDSGRLALEVLPAQSSQWRWLGSFAPAAVNEALRYAADRRVVAVTMVSGEPFARLQIQLNPELVDTPLGCRVVTIDRFVDTLDSMIPQVYAHRQAVEKLRVLMGVAATHPTELCSAKSLPKSFREMLEIPSGVPDQFKQKVVAELNNDASSVAALNSALQCGSKATAENMLGCVCQANPKIPSAKGLYVPSDVTSQVRERAFNPDMDFSWMRRTNNALGNVQFWLHMTLAWQPKEGASDTNPPDGKSTLAVDFADDDLNALNSRMPALVRAYVTSPRGLGANYDAFMQPVEDFVILQRFFRLALGSKFGPSFPKQKLVQLERDTRGLVVKQVTLRWQVETEKQEELLKAASENEYGIWQQYTEKNRNGESCGAM